ncbi:hypothetical protein ACIBTV_26715 [Micromonospora sp. NPDC049366]|uniref:hypothetical protein n=1 Tax=Micromonospora sp. NPDC049366 TaxID=3364271 RepID=UPI00378DA756
MGVMTVERRAHAAAVPTGYDPAVDTVRIAGAKETRVSFGDTLDRVEAGERTIVMQRNTVAFVLVSLPLYERIQDEIGEPPRSQRDTVNVALFRGEAWTPTLSAIASGKHITVVRNSRPAAVAMPPARYSEYLVKIGEPALALD